MGTTNNKSACCAYLIFSVVLGTFVVVHAPSYRAAVRAASALS